MPGHDVVIVEGYRKSGLPTIEVMRAGNKADSLVARVFAEGARLGVPLSADFIQAVRAGGFAASVAECTEEANASKCANAANATDTDNIADINNGSTTENID